MTERPTLRLSELVGHSVLGPGREPLGPLVDLVVGLGAAHPVVRRVGVGTRRRVRLAPFAGLSGPRRAVLVAGAPTGHALRDDEVRLVRDVLDTQVVDLDGRRLCRVSDVVLAEQPDGRVEVAAVDVGFGALLRRVGMGWAGDRLPAVPVDWADLHLTSSRGHLAQLCTAASGMHRLGAEGLAELLARLSAGQAVDVLGVLDPATAAAALGASHHSHVHRLLNLLPNEAAATVTAAASPSERDHLRAAAAAPRRRRHLRTAGWRLDRPAHSRPVRGVPR